MAKGLGRERCNPRGFKDVQLMKSLQLMLLCRGARVSEVGVARGFWFPTQDAALGGEQLIDPSNPSF